VAIVQAPQCLEFHAAIDANLHLAKKEKRVMIEAGLQRSRGTRYACGVIAMILLFPSVGQRAVAVDKGGWTLEQCLEYALVHGGDVQESEADVRIAESQLAQAKAGRWPRATFTNTSGAVNAARGDAVNGHTDDDDIGPFTQNELEVIQPLYNFGRIRAEIRAAARGVDAKRAATSQTRDATIARVKELYYTLLFSRQIKALLDEVKDNFTTALTTAEQRLESGEGTITQQDVLKLRIGLAGVSREVFTLARAATVTHSALRRQLGLPWGAEFDIAETSLEPVTVQLQPLAEYLERAGTMRPEIIQLEAGLAARRARLEAARSVYFPSVFLAGGIRHGEAPNRDDQHNPFVKDDFNYFNGGAALGVRWQMDFWMTHAKVAERAAELSKTEIQRDNAVSGIAIDIQQRYLEVQETQQQIDVAQMARKAVRALLVTTLANFRLGVGEGKDVFESLGLYSRVVGDYYSAVRNYNIAAAKLSQATGQEVTTLTYRR
jgi:outer membrane protein TolC